MTKRRSLEEEVARLNKAHPMTGEKQSAALGSVRYKEKVVPTGILALDYALGTGGWPLAHVVHIFGEPDIGKSSTLGLSAFAQAQALGMTCGVIAVEPGWDDAWAVKNGVDTDGVIVFRPKNGTSAFEVYNEWVSDDVVDFILFDSLGGVTTPSEGAPDGKAQVGGASGLITTGARRGIMGGWMRDKGIIFLNQVRDDLKSQYGGLKPSGGHAIQHFADIHIHLRQSPGGSTSVRKVKIDGEDITVGRNLTAVITRNKLCEGTGKKATFWYNNMATEEFGPVGIDKTHDIVYTATRTGVIKKSGGWYEHKSFDGVKLQGIPAVQDFFAEHPEAVDEIRKGVMAVMNSKVKFNEPGEYQLEENENE